MTILPRLAPSQHRGHHSPILDNATKEDFLVQITVRIGRIITVTVIINVGKTSNLRKLLSYKGSWFPPISLYRASFDSVPSKSQLVNNLQWLGYFWMIKELTKIGRAKKRLLLTCMATVSLKKLKLRNPYICQEKNMKLYTKSHHISTKIV